MRVKNSKTPIDWERVYWEQMPRIYNFFRYRICDDLIAEDLTATTFEKAWRYREKYRDDLSAFSTWLFTIARNVSTDYLRRQKLELPLHEDLYITDQESLDAIVQLEDDLAQLKAIIAQMSDREQEIISLKYGAELSHREIAEVMELSSSNIGVLVHRAIQSIRRQWETV